MPRTRIEVAHKIASPLHALEHAVDTALAEAALLTLAMVQGRGEAKVAAQVGQDAFDAIGQAHVTLVAARRQIVAAHMALNDVGRGLGLNVRAHGDESEKLPDGFTKASGRLQAVA